MGGRSHSAHGAHYIEAFNGMGRCLPHPKTQKHRPFRTPRSTRKAVVTLVLGFRPGSGGLDKTPFLLGGLEMGHAIYIHTLPLDLGPDRPSQACFHSAVRAMCTGGVSGFPA